MVGIASKRRSITRSQHGLTRAQRTRCLIRSKRASRTHATRKVQCSAVPDWITEPLIPKAATGVTPTNASLDSRAVHAGQGHAADQGDMHMLGTRTSFPILFLRMICRSCQHQRLAYNKSWMPEAQVQPSRICTSATLGLLGELGCCWQLGSRSERCSISR